MLARGRFFICKSFFIIVMQLAVVAFSHAGEAVSSRPIGPSGFLQLTNEQRSCLEAKRSGEASRPSREVMQIALRECGISAPGEASPEGAQARPLQNSDSSSGQLEAGTCAACPEQQGQLNSLKAQVESLKATVDRQQQMLAQKAPPKKMGDGPPGEGDERRPPRGKMGRRGGPPDGEDDEGFDDEDMPPPRGRGKPGGGGPAGSQMAQGSGLNSAMMMAMMGMSGQGYGAISQMAYSPLTMGSSYSPWMMNRGSSLFSPLAYSQHSTSYFPFANYSLLGSVTSTFGSTYYRSPLTTNYGYNFNLGSLYSPYPRLGYGR